MQFGYFVGCILRRTVDRKVAPNAAKLPSRIGTEQLLFRINTAVIKYGRRLGNGKAITLPPTLPALEKYQSRKDEVVLGMESRFTHIGKPRLGGIDFIRSARWDLNS